MLSYVKGGNNMIYFGFILSTIMYFAVLAALVFYIVCVARRKYNFANNLLPILFMHFLFSTMILSWTLILINSGFHFLLSLNVDYTFIFVLSIILLIAGIISDYFVKKNAYKPVNIMAAIGRHILPIFTVILFIANTIIYYFSCHYFAYLIA